MIHEMLLQTVDSTGWEILGRTQPNEPDKKTEFPNIDPSLLIVQNTRLETPALPPHVHVLLDYVKPDYGWSETPVGSLHFQSC